MTTYHVSKWGDYYENNRSRKVKDLAWVPIPNKHDGERYSRLMLRKDAAQIFAAWILILQVASRCHPRGSLLRSDGSPHDSDSLSVKTRAPKAWFDVALPILVEMRWLVRELSEQSSLALDCHHDDMAVTRRCQSGDEERIERNGMERTIAPVPSAVDGVNPDELKPRNPLFDELATAEGSDPYQLTKTAARSIAVALAEIKKAFPDLKEGEIKRRAEAYRKLMPSATLSAFALAKHWARCVPGADRYARADIYTEPPDWREKAAKKWPDAVLPATWNELSSALRNDLI